MNSCLSRSFLNPTVASSMMKSFSGSCWCVLPLYNGMCGLFRALMGLSVLVLLNVATARAQEATFSETFDDVPLGEVPDGWKWYSLNGGGGNNWVRSTYGFFGPELMVSGTETAMPGQLDVDWLVTPQLTPARGDYLIFDAGQEMVWDDFGSTFRVLVSTATSNRGDFTTLQSWTEPEFPGYIYEDRVIVDLSAYEGIPIYLAFVHENPVTAEDGELPPPSEMFYLDNVEVRPLKALDYSAGEVFSESFSVIRVAQSKTSVILGLVVRASGDHGTANITSFSFTTSETSPLIRIQRATLYTTYGDSFIATSEDEGIVYAEEWGSTANPGSEFTITGDQELRAGDNYFWLMFTLDADEQDLVYPFPKVNATFEQVVVNGVGRETTISTTHAFHSVVPPMPLNDSYGNASEIGVSVETQRYGSFNHRATFEMEFEKLAYCATPNGIAAMDGGNSVWWHFRPPGDGFITVDLSTCNFNTLLLILDINHDQLACNKDIDEESHIFQSKITNFDVKGGRDYYIRVAGEGDYPGDPNAASGVIHMDFTYLSPLAAGAESLQSISSLYPNPTDGVLYADLKIEKQGEVVLEAFDLMGRKVHTWNPGFMPAGSNRQIPLDISALTPGAYLVQVRGAKKSGGLKLFILEN